MDHPLHAGLAGGRADRYVHRPGRDPHHAPHERVTPMKKKTVWAASPYLVWMVAFIAAPLAIVLYFAFTDKAGHFTLANIMGLGAYPCGQVMSQFLQLEQ